MVWFHSKGIAVLVNPHGKSSLKPLSLSGDEREHHLRRAKELKKLLITSRELSDLLMLGMGAYTPLSGFMGKKDWQGCCVDMKLSSGVFWPIPITLSASQDFADGINVGEDVALVDSEQKIYGIITLDEKYVIDKKFECEHVFKTADEKHPGVIKVFNQGEVTLGGAVLVLDDDHYPETYKGLYFTPAQTRKLFDDKGWSTVAAFQTRNPMHRSHEYLAKIAVEVCDGLLIHQVLGALKDGDIPAEVRVDAIDTLVKNYFVDGTTVQAGYPIEMRYAGPREALLHALFRQNFGCSHLVVGRDHAGTGDYYGPFDAHHIFDEIPKASLETVALKIDITFYCQECDGMATGRTCPHPEESRLNVSGTRFREMLSNKEAVPTQFSRPEVIKVLEKYYYQ